MFHNFLFLQSDMGFGIVNDFSWIFDAVSSEKKLPDFDAFLAHLHWIQHSKVFSACWILIRQFKF